MQKHNIDNIKENILHQYTKDIIQDNINQSQSLREKVSFSYTKAKHYIL